MPQYICEKCGTKFFSDTEFAKCKRCGSERVVKVVLDDFSEGGSQSRGVTKEDLIRAYKEKYVEWHRLVEYHTMVGASDMADEKRAKKEMDKLLDRCLDAGITPRELGRGGGSASSDDSLRESWGTLKEIWRLWRDRK